MIKKSLLACLLVAVGFLGCEKSADNTAPNSQLNNKPLGASAREILSAEKPSIVIEIQYMPGYQLQPATLNSVTDFILAHTNKTGGVQIYQKQIGAASKSTLTINEVAQVEKDNRTAFSTSQQVAVYIVVTNGKYASDVNTLGTAYKNTSLSLYGQTIRELTGNSSPAFRSKLETTTIMHELGHLFGLVDLGTPMVVNHKDNDHAGHCINNKCLMYYKAEGPELLSYLTSGTLPSFDTNCRNDLRANGGK